MISMDKQYKTRDGREVELFAIRDDRVYGRERDSSGDDWRSNSWPLSNIDAYLIEVRPTVTRTVWLVHFGPASLHCAAAGHATQEAAASYAKQCEQNYDELLAITGPHTITFTPGEGL
jgi:hypothetical protein